MSVLLNCSEYNQRCQLIKQSYAAHDQNTAEALPAKLLALLLRDLEEHPAEHFPVPVDEQLAGTLAESF